MNSPLDVYSRGAQALILAAERLVADRGVEGTSIREILRQAGHANNSAVYHHFGSKEQLIATVFNVRQKQVDGFRQRRMEEAESFPASVKGIMELILIPVLDAFSGDGLITFAQFILQLILHDPESELFSGENEPPVIHEINRRFRATLPELPDNVFVLRYSMATTYFLHGIIYASRLTNARNDYLPSPAFWRDLVDGASATMLAAYRPDPFP